MKVIKKGSTGKKKKCNFCKSIFIYKYEDMRMSEYVVCPICKSWLKPSMFDKKVKEVE